MLPSSIFRYVCPVILKKIAKLYFILIFFRTIRNLFARPHVGPHRPGTSNRGFYSYTPISHSRGFTDPLSREHWNNSSSRFRHLWCLLGSCRSQTSTGAKFSGYATLRKRSHYMAFRTLERALGPINSPQPRSTLLPIGEKCHLWQFLLGFWPGSTTVAPKDDYTVKSR